MPLFFLVAGIFFVVSAIRGTQDQLLALLKNDFISANGFGTWVIAVVAIGALGYVQGLKTISNGLLILVVLVMLLSNKGFFSKFQQAFVK